jgi:hypothetical protein
VCQQTQKSKFYELEVGAEFTKFDPGKEKPSPLKIEDDPKSESSVRTIPGIKTTTGYRINTSLIAIDPGRVKLTQLSYPSICTEDEKSYPQQVTYLPKSKLFFVCSRGKFYFMGNNWK